MVTTVKYFVITVTFDQLNASMLNKSVFVCVLLICILNEIGIGVHKQVLDILVEINEKLPQCTGNKSRHSHVDAQAKQECFFSLIC